MYTYTLARTRFPERWGGKKKKNYWQHSLKDSDEVNTKLLCTQFIHSRLGFPLDR